MRRINPKFRKSLAAKLAVFFGSLLVCLALLEAGLRLTGFAIAASRQRLFVPPYDEEAYDSDYTFERYRSKKSGARLILTFGDSLTNGGNVRSYHSYPYYLHKGLAAAGRRAAVYNMGYCEDSTFGVASKFRSYLKSHRAEELPDAVVILVGAADLFNLPLIKERMMRDDSFWRDMVPGGWFYQLRLYKVYRHIKTNLALRRGMNNERARKASAEEKFAKLLAAYEERKKMPGPGRPRSLSPARAKALAPYFEDDLRQFDMELTSVPDFMELVADYGSMVYISRLRYDKFFGLLLDMAETFPEDFWINYFDAAGYQFFQTYQVQSKYTAADVLKVLDGSAKAHPRVADNEAFKTFRKLLLDREGMDRYVDRKRMQAWEDIVRLARAKKVRLVLQNYPVEYKSANRIIEAVAAKYGLPLVDNRAHFAGLIEKDGRRKYLEDNDHMTPFGYKVLAANVLRALTDIKPFATDGGLK